MPTTIFGIRICITKRQCDELFRELEENRKRAQASIAHTFPSVSSDTPTIAISEIKHARLLCEALCERELDRQKINPLLEAATKADINGFRDDQGLSVLHIATMRGDVEIINAICTKSDVNIKDNLGFTALHYAVMMKDPFNIIASLLKQEGIDVNIQNTQGYTALDIIQALQRVNLEKDKFWEISALLKNHQAKSEKTLEIETFEPPSFIHFIDENIYWYPLLPQGENQETFTEDSSRGPLSYAGSSDYCPPAQAALVGERVEVVEFQDGSNRHTLTQQNVLRFLQGLGNLPRSDGDEHDIEITTVTSGTSDGYEKIERSDPPLLGSRNSFFGGYAASTRNSEEEVDFLPDTSRTPTPDPLDTLSQSKPIYSPN